MPSTIRIVRDRKSNQLVILLPDSAHGLPAEYEHLAPGIDYERFITGEVPGIFLENMAGAIVEVDPL